MTFMQQNTNQVKTTQGQALHEAGQQNGAISSGASETFFSRQADKEACSRYGSFNNLEIVNNTTNTIAIDLDGQTTRRRVLFGKSSLVIKPDQNIFFNNVVITDMSAANISANTVFALARVVR